GAADDRLAEPVERRIDEDGNSGRFAEGAKQRSKAGRRVGLDGVHTHAGCRAGKNVAELLGVFRCVVTFHEGRGVRAVEMLANGSVETTEGIASPGITLFQEPVEIVQDVRIERAREDGPRAQGPWSPFHRTVEPCDESSLEEGTNDD